MRKSENLTSNQIEYFNEIIVGGESQFDESATISIQRPLLNYPAVIFTGKYQAAGQNPVDLLIQSVNGPGSNKTPGIADPDVTKSGN